MEEGDGPVVGGLCVCQLVQRGHSEAVSTTTSTCKVSVHDGYEIIRLKVSFLY